MAVSPDGRLLVTNDQSSVRLWDVATSQPLGQALKNELVEALAYCPSGQAVTVGTPNGPDLRSSFLWGTLAKLRIEVCNLTGGDLTPAEWKQAAPGNSSHQQPCR